jgi:hypothetical protein
MVAISASGPWLGGTWSRANGRGLRVSGRSSFAAFSRGFCWREVTIEDRAAPVELRGHVDGQE